jgi:hypothetical protein
MPATSGIAVISIAGMARSYPAGLSLFVVPTCGDGGSENPSVFSVLDPR